MKTNKGIAHLFLLVIIIFIAIVAVGYLAYQNAQLKKQAGETTTTPESTETTNWKTYNNNEYFFSFKYPSSWLLGEETPTTEGDSYELRIYLRPVTPTPPGDLGYGLIQIVLYSSNLSLDDYIDTRLCASPGVCASSQDSIDIEIASIIGKKIINRPGPPIPTESVIFKKGDYIFNVNIGLDKSYEKLLGIEDKRILFNQVISTFEFIDESNSFSCPDEKIINCIPPQGLNKKYCQTDYQDWIKENCPEVTVAW